MAQIGKLGSLVTFKTSDKKILTYKDYNSQISARWSKHERIGKRPKMEFLGKEQGEVTFTVELDASLGVKPWKVMHKMRMAAARGRVYILVIGKHRVGDKKWYIERMSEMHNITMNKGEIVSATVELTLKEYA